MVSVFFDAFSNASRHSGFSPQVNTCKGNNGTSDLLNSTQSKVIILEFIWTDDTVNEFVSSHFSLSSALWRGCNKMVSMIFIFLR